MPAPSEHLSTDKRRRASSNGASAQRVVSESGKPPHKMGAKRKTVNEKRPEEATGVAETQKRFRKLLQRDWWPQQRRRSGAGLYFPLAIGCPLQTGNIVRNEGEYGRRGAGSSFKYTGLQMHLGPGTSSQASAFQILYWTSNYFIKTNRCVLARIFLKAGQSQGQG